MTYCDAAYAYLSGKNPYLVDSYQLSKLSFVYPSFFCPSQPVCVGRLVFMISTKFMHIFQHIGC